MTPAPACCAGLRQTLLHEGQHDFPLHESPFQLVARRLGAGVREVLHHCQVLLDEGALQGIRLSWAPRMMTVRWRVLYRLPAPPGPPAPPWESVLSELPGVAEFCVGEPLARGSVSLETGAAAWLWFDIVAHREADAERQRAAVEAAAGSAASCFALGGMAQELRQEVRQGVKGAGGESEEAPALPCAADAPTLAAAPGCPCEDEPLARQAESLLPLATHPYRSIAQALGRSEREVIAALRRWRKDGHLAGAGFVRGDAPGVTSSLMAVLHHHAGDSDLPHRLLARPGILAVQRFANDPQLAWLVSASGTPQQAQHMLERALTACVVPLPHPLLRVRRTRLKHAPLLFSIAPA
jgi:DNA-binding Lrp family transcriptional regulator